MTALRGEFLGDGQELEALSERLEWTKAFRSKHALLMSERVIDAVTAEEMPSRCNNRLLSLGPIPPNLVTLPLPDAGGAKPLFAPESGSRNPGTTVYWAELTEQLLRIPQLRLIVLDPLQPLCALDLNVPENAQLSAPSSRRWQRPPARR